MPLAGSRHFVQKWLPAWLRINYGNNLPPGMHGVIILDTMMEYNTSANSQMIPSEIKPQVYYIYQFSFTRNYIPLNNT